MVEGIGAAAILILGGIIGWSEVRSWVRVVDVYLTERRGRRLPPRPSLHLLR